MDYQKKYFEKLEIFSCKKYLMQMFVSLHQLLTKNQIRVTNNYKQKISKICKELKLLSDSFRAVQNSAAKWAELASLSGQKAIVRIQFLAYFCIPFYQIGMKKVVKCWIKDFFLVFHDTINLPCIIDIYFFGFKFDLWS